MSSNYNRIPRPAGLLVNNGEAELFKESPHDLLKFDVLPQSLYQVKLSHLN